MVGGGAGCSDHTGQRGAATSLYTLRRFQLHFKLITVGFSHTHHFPTSTGSPPLQHHFICISESKHQDDKKPKRLGAGFHRIPDVSQQLRLPADVSVRNKQHNPPHTGTEAHTNPANAERNLQLKWC